jgi:hypothetical protein
MAEHGVSSRTRDALQTLGSGVRRAHLVLEDHTPARERALTETPERRAAPLSLVR